MIVHWVINGVPACSSSLQPSGTGCALDAGAEGWGSEFERYRVLVLEKNPEAKVEIVWSSCPQPQSYDDRQDDEDCTPPCLAKMLDLSTGHVPDGVDDKEPFLKELRFLENEMGWVVWVLPGAENLPEWFKPIHDLAVLHDCILINFDRDADEHPDLPIY
jgi:hypothetical protein